MRGLLSAARRTGVLGPNASPAPIAPSGLLPCRRVPSPGLGCPTASLRETAAFGGGGDDEQIASAATAANISRATAPSSAASPASAAGDESQGKIKTD